MELLGAADSAGRNRRQQHLGLGVQLPWQASPPDRHSGRRRSQDRDFGENIEEVLRVLRLKFLWTPEALEEAKSQMNAIARKVAPTRAVDLIEDDPTDNRILECAAEAKSDYIVTGDKDLLRLGAFGGAPIVKVADFLEVVESG